MEKDSNLASMQSIPDLSEPDLFEDQSAELLARKEACSSLQAYQFAAKKQNTNSVESKQSSNSEKLPKVGFGYLSAANLAHMD